MLRVKCSLKDPLDDVKSTPVSGNPSAKMLSKTKRNICDIPAARLQISALLQMDMQNQQSDFVKNLLSSKNDM